MPCSLDEHTITTLTSPLYVSSLACRTLPSFWCWIFPGSSKGKEFVFNAGEPGWIPGLGRSPAEGNSNPLQYFCLEKFHEQRSLLGYGPWGHRVGQDWVTNALFLMLDEFQPETEFTMLSLLDFRYIIIDELDTGSGAIWYAVSSSGETMTLAQLPSSGTRSAVG